MQKYINKVRDLEKRIKKLEEASKKTACLGDADSILQTAKAATMMTYATGNAPGNLIKKKILPQYFEDVMSGAKTFELRKDEDNIQPGDTLDLLEWNQDYTGRGIRCQVTYVLRDCSEYGLRDGYCIVGIEKVCPVVSINNGSLQTKDNVYIRSISDTFATPGIIKREDLMFTGDLEDDRTNVCVSLDDYDWMRYVFTTRFRTMTYGQLHVCIEYFGSQICTMDIKQTTPADNTVITYRYKFSSELFVKHYKKYLNAHMSSIDDKYAFSGETFILDFYNDIIKESKDKAEIVNKSRMSDDTLEEFIKIFEKCMTSEDTMLQKNRYWEKDSGKDI